VPEKVAFGQCAQNIVIDQFKYFLFLGVLLEAGVLNIGVDHDEVLLALAN